MLAISSTAGLIAQEFCAERTRQAITAWNGMNGQQGGDPAKLAAALVLLAGQDQPPRRWVAGAEPSRACGRRPGT